MSDLMHDHPGRWPCTGCGHDKPDTAYRSLGFEQGETWLCDECCESIRCTGCKSLTRDLHIIRTPPEMRLCPKCWQFLQYHEQLHKAMDAKRTALKEALSLRIRTVNIVEMRDGAIQGLTSFPDNAEGSGAAEDLFEKLVLEHGANIDPVVLEGCIVDGCYSNDDGYIVSIVHST